MRRMPQAASRLNMNSPTVRAMAAALLPAKLRPGAGVDRLRAGPQFWIMRQAGPRIDAVDVAAYVVPTESPESDGTLEWDQTTLVVVEVAAGGVRGLGFTYADVATAAVVRATLAG